MSIGTFKLGNNMTKTIKKLFDIAVLGATVVVGETMLEILAYRKFTYNKVYALASEKSAGETVMLGNKTLDVFFFFTVTATTEIYTLSLHDALPIYPRCGGSRLRRRSSWPQAPSDKSMRPARRGIDIWARVARPVRQPRKPRRVSRKVDGG